MQLYSNHLTSSTGLVPIKHHMLAFSGSMSEGGPNTLPAVNDAVYTITDDKFVAFVDSKIIYAVGIDCNGCRLRIISPSLNTVAYPSIQPLNIDLGGQETVKVMDFKNYPIKILDSEEFGIDVVNGIEGNADIKAFIGICSDVVRSPNLNGKHLLWVRVTASSAVVTENVWSAATIVFDDTLPAGNYEVYGLRIIEVTGSVVAGRIIFSGQTERPGTIAVESYSNLNDKIFQAELGLWGTFSSVALPTFELFSLISTTLNAEIYFLISKI